jgi:hypothetical protein
MSIAVRNKEMDIIRRRFEILVTARLRKGANIREAVKVQDRIREKAGRWSGAREIRKWRDRR